MSEKPNVVTEAMGLSGNIMFGPSTASEIEVDLKRLERAVNAAFYGTAEHGSFFRRDVPSGEWVPCVFMTLNNLRRNIAKLAKAEDRK